MALLIQGTAGEANIGYVVRQMFWMAIERVVAWFRLGAWV